MSRLKKEHKLYIVRSLAVFNTPTEVANAIKVEFGLDLKPQNIEVYDPTKRAGRDLSAELKQEFEETREEYLAKPQNIPIANLTVRLKRMEDQYQRHAKNPVVALNTLKQAAEDAGGKFTNKVESNHTSTTKLVTENHVPKDEYLKAREQALDEY